MRYGITRCSLGQLIVGWSERGLCAIELGDDEKQLLALLHAHFPGQAIEPANSDESDLLAEVARFIEQPAGTLALPLAPEGTRFQRDVWTVLRSIPPGTTLSYSEVARRLGKPNAVRAVASACGANRLAVVIPCHRVVRADGGLGGFHWGLERKQALLNREATLAASVP